ncbi:MAG: Rrf2 family transcriptional regulator [Rhodospirillaceae bacterium]
MKPTTKSELALNGMVELAKLRHPKPLALAQLAKKQTISLSYLEQIFAALRRSGLVLSVRGPGGGYLLARSSETITAGEIVSAVDSPKTRKARNISELEGNYSAIERNVDAFWSLMKGRTIELYHQISLQDIVDGNLLVEENIQDLSPQAAE